MPSWRLSLERADSRRAPNAARAQAGRRAFLAAMAVVSGLAACSLETLVAPQLLRLTGASTDLAPSLVLPPADEGGANWRPAETRAGPLAEMLDALELSDAELGLIADGVAAHELAARLEAHLERSVAVLSGRPDLGSAEAKVGALLSDPALREQIEAQGLTQILIVAASSLDEKSWRGQEAQIFGGCELLRSRLGRGQEFALARLEAFLDRADDALANSFVAALQKERGALETLVMAAKAVAAKKDPEAKLAPICGEHAQSLLACAGTQTPCEWSPRVFLQGKARVGRKAESLELAFSQDGCAQELEEIMFRVDASAKPVLSRFASRWSEFAARAASLGAIDAALEDACAPRRRRTSEESMQQLRARLDTIEELLARGGEPSGDGGPQWVSELPSPESWREGEGSFHVPGLGPIRELAYFDGGPGSASRKLINEAEQLREAILGAVECAGVAGELPLAWAVVELPSGRSSARGVVFPETLLCGDMPLLP